MADKQFIEKERKKYEEMVKKEYTLYWQDKQKKVQLKKTDKVEEILVKAKEAFNLPDEEYKLRIYKSLSKVPAAYVKSTNTVAF